MGNGIFQPFPLSFTSLLTAYTITQVDTVIQCLLLPCQKKFYKFSEREAMELVYIAVIQLQSLRDFPPTFMGQVPHFQNQLIHVSRATRSGAMISTRCTSKLSYSIAGRHEDSPHPRWEGCGWWGSVLCCYRSLAPPWAQWPAVMKTPSAAAVFESNNLTVSQYPLSLSKRAASEGRDVVTCRSL